MDGRTRMRSHRGPWLTVDALWVRDGAVLLVRRKHAPFRGRWALPGGFVELDETVEEAVRRELFEETGLSARPRHLVGVYSGPDRDPRGSVTSVVFWMEGAKGTPRGGDDASDAAWVPIGQARTLAFDHDRILLDGLEGAARRRRRTPRSGLAARDRPRRAGPTQRR